MSITYIQLDILKYYEFGYGGNDEIFKSDLQNYLFPHGDEGGIFIRQEGRYVIFASYLIWNKLACILSIYVHYLCQHTKYYHMKSSFKNIQSCLVNLLLLLSHYSQPSLINPHNNPQSPPDRYCYHYHCILVCPST